MASETTDFAISIDDAARILVLTGAGISAESGLRTFRDSGGLWENHAIEDVATPEGFVRDPKLVWRFYCERRKQAADARPNAAHLALAALEHSIGERLFVVTQNVDDLHEKAGTRNLVHMHGELTKTRCTTCDRAPFDDVDATFDVLPKCDRCGGLLRPHICWFGEIPFEERRIYSELERASVFVTIGSSGSVYPAAGYVRDARRCGGPKKVLVYVGLERPQNADDFDVCVLGKATEIVPRLFGAL
jgi:NAD-dependent deacetylase